jgi:hypothetical protein
MTQVERNPVMHRGALGRRIKFGAVDDGLRVIEVEIHDCPPLRRSMRRESSIETVSKTTARELSVPHLDQNSSPSCFGGRNWYHELLL